MESYLAVINGKKVEFSSGSTILEVARNNSISIPTLCHLNGHKSIGSCGVCVVEAGPDGDLVPACSTPMEEGMHIRTESPLAVKARQEALTRIASSGEHNCFVLNLPQGKWTDFQVEAMARPWHQGLCPSWGKCELQDLVVKYGLNGFKLDQSSPKSYPLDDSHPMFVRDYSRCIRCGRCIQACEEIQGNMAIPRPEGWTDDAPPPETAIPQVDYERCEHCGNCVQACPVGALFEKKSYEQSYGNDVELVRSTCPYCGVGCQQWLHVKDGRIVQVTGVENGAPNMGRLCVKGRYGYDFIYSKERLLHPMIRENGELRQASWDEALDLVASKIKETIDKHGPDSLAGVSCARSINEDSYQMQKLFRAVIKTNNIDHCART